MPGRPRPGGTRVCQAGQAIDSNGRTIWIADAHRGDGMRFVVRAEEELTAFVELKLTIFAGALA